MSGLAQPFDEQSYGLLHGLLVFVAQLVDAGPHPPAAIAGFGVDVQGEPLIGRELLDAVGDQTTNTWDPLLEMARNGRVYDEFAIEPMDSFVNIPPRFPCRRGERR